MAWNDRIQENIELENVRADVVVAHFNVLFPLFKACLWIITYAIQQHAIHCKYIVACRPDAR